MKLLKKLFQPVDMTEGTPWKKIVIFMFPMLIGNIAQQLYATVDSIVVGKYEGDNALAAVGAAGPTLNLLLVLFVGISMGATIMVSQYFGARDRKGISFSVGNCITLVAIASIIIMIIAPIISRPMLELLKTPEVLIDQAESYLLITFIGVAGMAYYNILGAILRGLGDSMSSLVYLLIATVLNIILDIIFVAYFGMGVDGVALATVIAQGFSAFLCLFRLMKMKDIFDFKKEYLVLKRKYSGTMIKLGLPSGITQAIVSMAMLIVQPLTNSFGELVIASSTIVMRVDGFAMVPTFSFGNAMTTYAGQNVGAKKDERLSVGSKQGTFVAVAVTTAITGVILLLGRQIMGCFTDTVEVIDLSMKFMCILGFGYVAMAVNQSLSGIIRGSGDTMTPMWISLICTVFTRIPLVYFLVYMSRSAENPIGQPECIHYSLLITWTLSAVVTYIYYRSNKWRNKGIS